MVLAETATAETPRLCECGCGEPVKSAKSRFAPGHNNYARWGSQPTCRGCGRKATTRRHRLLSYDHETNTYQCKWCKSRDVRCRRCGTIVAMPPHRIKKLKSLRSHDGNLTYLCNRCQGHDRSKVGRSALLRKHFGITAADGKGDRDKALKDHFENYPLKAAGGRPQLLRKANLARAGGITEPGRERLAIKRIIGSLAKRKGELRLCPICGTLIYVPAHRVREGRPGLHARCYHELQRMDEYKAWRRQPRRYSHPLIHRPRHRPVTPEALALHLRWLLRRFLLRQSLREIATAESYHWTTIDEGVNAMVGRLPDTWNEVFGGKSTGHRLDQLLPIARLRS